jgi:hypothetical protein
MAASTTSRRSNALRFFRGVSFLRKSARCATKALTATFLGEIP